MEAAIDQCEENLIEINITNYLRSVCKHFNKLLECNNVEPLHKLIKEKFEKIMTSSFSPVPTHPGFYYCSPMWSLKKSSRQQRDDDFHDFHSQRLQDRIIENLHRKGNITFQGRIRNTDILL